MDSTHSMTVGFRLSLASVIAAVAPPDILLAAHSSRIVRDGFEPSDVALFVAAVFGVWFARRSMRARAKARRLSNETPPSPPSG